MRPTARSLARCWRRRSEVALAAVALVAAACGDPNGPRRLADDVDAIFGVTVDGQVAAHAQGGTGIAVPVDGGAVVSLGAEVVAVSGHRIFVQRGTALSAWTAAGGARAISMRGARPALSADERWLAWLEGYDAGGQFGDLVLAPTDGTPTLTLFYGVSTAPACPLEVHWEGARLWVARCPRGREADGAFVSRLDPATGDAVTLAGGVWPDLIFDPTDARLAAFAALPSGGASTALDVYDAATGARTPLSTDARGPFFRADGDLVYLEAGTVVRAPHAGPQPLAASCDGELGPRTPDGRWVLCVPAGGAALSLVDTEGPGAVGPLPVAGAPLAPPVAGFTADGAWAVWLDDATAADPSVGTLRAMPVDGGAVRTLATRVRRVASPHGTHLVWVEGVDGAPGAAGTLRTVELAAGAPALTLAEGADAVAWLASSDTGRVLYLASTDGRRSLWAARLPASP